jgi:hypothetical protein
MWMSRSPYNVSDSGWCVGIFQFSVSCGERLETNKRYYDESKVESRVNICIYMCNFQWSKHALKNNTHTVIKNKNMCLTCKFLYIIWLTIWISNGLAWIELSTCINVIVTWSLMLMDTFSSLNVYWRMHRAWLACFFIQARGNVGI